MILANYEVIEFAGKNVPGIAMIHRKKTGVHNGNILYCV